MDQALFEAVRKGEGDLVAALLRTGADPNARESAKSSHGDFFADITPLMAAAISPRSNVEVIQALLDGGADMSAKSRGKVTATWYSCGGVCTWAGNPEPDDEWYWWSGGDAARLAYLLDRGGDPNETASNGRTCVYEAASIGDPDRLKLLLDHGAKPGPGKAHTLPSKGSKVLATAIELVGVQIGDAWRMVPLHAAAEGGSVECIRLLVEAGFPPHYGRKSNALNYASSREVAEYLWSLGVRPADRGWQDCVSEAFEDERFEVAEYLLTKIREEDSAQGRDWQAYVNDHLVHQSGVYMNPQAVRILLRLGGDVNFKSSGVGSPLRYACWQGQGNSGRLPEVDEEVIQMLIEAGADLHEIDKCGQTVLHEAVTGDWESPVAVRVLLENGFALINAQDNNGETALTLAGDKPACVRVLLEHGADPNIKNHKGLRASDTARDTIKNFEGSKEDYLQKACAEAKEALRLLEEAERVG